MVFKMNNTEKKINEKFVTVLTATFGYEIAIIRGKLE